MKILFDFKPPLKQIFPRRKSTNPVSGTNLENFYQLQANSIDNLKQIWIYSTHPTHEKLTIQNWNLQGFKMIYSTKLLVH